MLDVLRRHYKKSETYEIVTRFNRQKATTRRFLQMPQAKRDQIRLLMGHMDFGFHKQFSNPAKYITMLRDPVGRIISSYYYTKSHPRHYLHDAIVKGNVSLKEYASGDFTYQLENGMTKNLSGIRSESGACTQEMFEAARQNVREHFLSIGLLERYDLSLLLYKKILDWPDYPVYFKKNVTEKGTETEEVDPETLSIIRTRNHFDVQLYEEAVKAFEEYYENNRDWFDTEMKRFSEALDQYRKANQYKDSIENFARNIYKQVVKWVKK